MLDNFNFKINSKGARQLGAIFDTLMKHYMVCYPIGFNIFYTKSRQVKTKPVPSAKVSKNHFISGGAGFLLSKVRKTNKILKKTKAR